VISVNDLTIGHWWSCISCALPYKGGFCRSHDWSKYVI